MTVAQAIEPAPARAVHGVGRGRLLLAYLYDFATLCVALVGSSAVATVWMLARTSWGRFDLRTGDAVVALAIAISAGPAWTAWQWLHLWGDGATFGRRRAVDDAARVSTSLGAERWQGRAGRVRCGIWLVLHPVSLPFWAWLTAVLLATGTMVFIILSVLPLATALAAALLAVTSLLMLLVRPSLVPLHIWLARASFGERQ